MEFIFCMQINIKISTSWQIITTNVMFYCDAKHSDILRGSCHLRCYLFFGDCGQKWAQRFRLWNSKI